MDNLIVNGGFDTNTDWTLGAGWTIGSGLLSWNFDIGAPSSVSPIASIALVAGEKYNLSFEATNVKIGAAGDNFTISLGGDVVATITEDTVIDLFSPLTVVCGPFPELDIVISGTSVSAGTIGAFDNLALILFVENKPPVIGTLDIVNQALTTSSDYSYTVPAQCISLVIQARDGAISFTEGADPNIWTQDSGTKEEYNSDIAVVMRGQTLVFNAITTANLEIRSMIDNRI